MQIHEFMKRGQQPLDEGLWDAVKGTLTKDPKLAGMSLAQKIKATNTDTALDQISKASYDNWVAKWYQIGNAKKGQVTQQDFQNELTSFVKTNLLPRYANYDQLSVKNNLDQNIRAIASTYLKGDQAAAKKYFRQMVSLASIAREEVPAPGGQAPTQQAQQAQQQQQSGTAAQNQNPAALVKALTAQLGKNGLSSGGLSKTIKDIQAINQGQPLKVASTRHPLADSLLNLFGIKT